MHKEGETPYIGKLVKIWENPDKSRKIKVHWFFRPSEISYDLKDVKLAENEIFLASGEGTGLANVNPLEAIAGKCNVRISEDNRNSQPSEEEVKMADHVFCRTFHVGKCAISDKMDDKVGELDVKYIFNKKESEKASHVPRFAKNTVECQATSESSGLKRDNNIETAKESHVIGKSDIDEQISLVRQDALQRETNALRINQETTEKRNSSPGEQNPQFDSVVAKATGKLSHLVGKSDVDVKNSNALHGGANDSSVKQKSTKKGNPVTVQIVSSKTATTVHKINASNEENVYCKFKNDKDRKKLIRLHPILLKLVKEENP